MKWVVFTPILVLCDQLKDEYEVGNAYTNISLLNFGIYFQISAAGKRK